MTEGEARFILGLRESYTLQDIKRAYRTKVLETHPDRNGGDNSRFLQVKKAYEEIVQYHSHRTNTSYTHTTKQTYTRRTQADQAYKSKMKDEIFWRKYQAAKQKKYEADYKENLKFGCLIVAIIVLICMLFGKDPEEYTRRNSHQSEYE